jgi:hypothetical protein
MSIPLEVRKGWVEALPWVRRLKKPVSCDGIKWGKVALSDLFARGDKPARGIQDRARCKKNAEWHYKGLESSQLWVTEGNFCWAHLPLDHTGEHERWVRYTERYPEKFPQLPRAEEIRRLNEERG